MIIHYIEKIKEDDDRPLKLLCVFFYVLATHRWETLLNKLQQNNIHVVFVLASCTDQVQPINLAFNAAFEQYTCMKAQYDE